jgi:hypothetical protein
VAGVPSDQAGQVRRRRRGFENGDDAMKMEMHRDPHGVRVFKCLGSYPIPGGTTVWQLQMFTVGAAAKLNVFRQYNYQCMALDFDLEQSLGGEDR